MATYAISDLHGRMDLFRQVKEFLQPEDVVYVLGDCGDRGPAGWELIKTVYEDPQFIYLMGNHEDMLVDAMRSVFTAMDIIRENHYSLLGQEISRGCLIKMKQTSSIQFFKYLFVEWHRYGWKLFYRDLVGAGFETYETNLFVAIINHCRVKAGKIKCFVLKKLNIQ